MKKKGKNLSYLRTTNQAAVLEALSNTDYCSRMELTELVSLTKMSISNITAELLSKGIIEEYTPPETSTIQSHAAGRKPVLLRVKENCIQAIGIYVDRRCIHCSLSDITQTQLAHIEYPTSSITDAESMISIIKKGIRSLLNNDKAKHVIGIGLGCIGLIDSKQGVIEDTTDFFEIHDVPIRKILMAEFDLPVFATNDMKASALAEFHYGSARQVSSFVYLGITDGVGSGIILNGHLFEGGSGFSSEFGHLSINPSGERCSCGNHGCLELYASVPVLLAKSKCTSWPEFIEKSRQPKQLAHKVFKRFLSDLSTALINIANLLDPEIIVLGHEASLLPLKDVAFLEDTLNSCMMTRRFKHTRVVTAAFGRDTPIVGTTSLVYSKVFSGDIPI